MLLKYFNTNDFDLNSSFHKGLNKIQKLSKFQKIMTYFWILGPLIFLIERDPADLWLTLISIIFLIMLLCTLVLIFQGKNYKDIE